MADFIDIFEFISTPDGSTLRNKISIAANIKAQALLDGASPTTGQVTWAYNTLRFPVPRATILTNYVLAKNNTSTIAQINAASDATIQSNVNDAADALIDGGVE